MVSFIQPDIGAGCQKLSQETWWKKLEGIVLDRVMRSTQSRTAGSVAHGRAENERMTHPVRFAMLLLLGAPAAFADDAASLVLEATYTGELWRQVSGGLATGERYLDNLDLTLAADGEALLGLEGLQFFGYVLYNNGHVFCEELSGSAQCVSNIEATPALRLYELWTEWQLGAQGQSVRFGLYDLNSEFDSIDTTSLFITPSQGIGPDLSQTGEHGPSIFPETSFGVRALKSVGAWTVQTAALNPVTEGVLLIGEANYRPESGLRIGGGYWHYTSDHNAGAYGIVESPALIADAEDRGLRLYARVGRADPDINPIATYFGGGVVYSMLSSAQREHQIGFAVANAVAIERNYELTYRIAVADWLALQSDVQYVQPEMPWAVDAGWAVGLRFEIGSRWAR
jgi:porin